MKQLFWKEWREIRLLPVAAALTMGILLVGVKTYTRSYHQTFPTPEMLLPGLVAVWLLFGVLAGAGLFSQEIGAGTIQFLSSLPVPRRTVWWVKVTTALGALLLSMLGSAVVWLILCAVWSPTGLALIARQTSWLNRLQGTGFVLLFLLNWLAIALAVSPFCDRSLIASVAAILTCIATDASISTIARNLSHSGGDYGYLLFTLVGLTVPTFALISYMTFTRGESLRSAQRFIVAAKAGGACLAVWVAVIGVGRLLLQW